MKKVNRRQFLMLAGSAAAGGLVAATNITNARSQIAKTPVAYLPAVFQNEYQLKNIIFLHHSVGHLILSYTDRNYAGMRAVLNGKGYQFWDHGYNATSTQFNEYAYGLRNPSGTPVGYDYKVPLDLVTYAPYRMDNTDPDGLYNIFIGQTIQPDPNKNAAPPNTLTGLMRHDVIVFKSCYLPVRKKLTSDAVLNTWKSYYIQMRDEFFKKHPEKMFIALTPTPVLMCNITDTTRARDARARNFANWMKSSEFTSGAPNVFVFDLFDLLAYPETHPSANTLNHLYRENNDTCDSDGHPNAEGCKIVSPLLANFIDASIRTYHG